MPEVPIFQSQQGIPRAQPNFQSDAPEQQLIQAVGKAGEAVAQAAFTFEERRAKAKIQERANTHREASLERYLDDQEKRRGAAALKDGDKAGVFDSYSDWAKEQEASMISDIPAAFQQDAKRTLGSVTAGFQGKYASYEAAQFQQHQDTVKDGDRKTRNAEIAIDMQQGLGAQAVADSLFGVEGVDAEGNQVFDDSGAMSVIRANSSGRDTSLEELAAGRQLVSNAVLAKASEDWKGAEVVLKDKRFKDFLDASDRKTLRAEIEKNKIDQESDKVLATVAGSSLENKLSVAQKVQDRDIRDAAIRKITTDDRLKEAITTEQRADRYGDYWDRVITQKNVPTDKDIINDPLLREPQKEHLLNMMSGSGSGIDKKAMASIEDELYTGMFTPDNTKAGGVLTELRDIDDAFNKNLIDRTTQVRLRKAFEAKDDFPDMGAAISEARRQYGKALDDDVEIADFNNRMQARAEKLRQQQRGREVGYKDLKEIARSIMEEKAEASIWNAFGFFAGEGLDVPSPDIIEIQKRRFKEQFPDVEYNSTENVFELKKNDDGTVLTYSPQADEFDSKFVKPLRPPKPKR